jgi:hypothetical protein
MHGPPLQHEIQDSANFEKQASSPPGRSSFYLKDGKLIYEAGQNNHYSAS